MVNTPPATILSMFNEELHSSLRTWDLPFRLLLNALKITRRLESSDDEIEATQHRFCFQPNHDLSALSRIFISVNLFSGISYKIDLNHDDIQDNSSAFLAHASVAALRTYADHALASARGYRDQLIKQNIMDIDELTLFNEVDLMTCPLCYSYLNICGVCHAVAACSYDECAGWEVANFEECDEHESMTCHDCLESKDLDLSSTFARCPTCNSWRCSNELDWCPGRIIHPLPGTEEFAELSKKWDIDNDRNSLLWSHSPKPGPCKTCTLSGHANEWQACNVRESNLCPAYASGSYLERDLAYCPECIAEHKGRRCVCSAVWSCEACLLVDPESIIRPDLISCARCGAAYCTQGDGCQYCQFCHVCRRAGICFGCQAQEKRDVGRQDTSHEDSQLLNGYERCRECWVHICDECCSTGKDGAVQCSDCRRWMCGKCATQGCSSCS